jgi:Tol biopolymer transport system component
MVGAGWYFECQYRLSLTGADAQRLDQAMQVLAQGEISAQVSFSPDGSSIAFSRLRRGRNGSLLRDLYVSDPHGNLVRLTSDCNAVDPDWSPDGRRLVFVDEQNANPISISSMLLAAGRSTDRPEW